MTRPIALFLVTATLGLIAALATPQAAAQPSHGIAMAGEPALPPDFVSLPYADPNAPVGGRIVFGETGGFDSLNPYILKGRAPWGVRIHVVESLMGRNWDEPFTLYGLLAESVETDAARSFVEFTLRPEARFSDGSPVTVEDVLWSFETLGTIGHPRYVGAWGKIAKAEATGPRSVRFTFNTEDRELPLIMGLRPILKKASFDGRDFAESSLEPVIGSGPYVIEAFEPGRFVTFRRNPDYWGRDLAFNRGQNNIAEIRYDYFADGSVLFEAFKAGAIDVFREASAARWATNYDFPAVAAGTVIKEEVPHGRPSGIDGFVMNTRRAQFADWRVREAMIEAFNYDFIARTINGGTDPRITSYFSNSILGMREGPATGRVADILSPFAADLPPGTIEGYALPSGDGTDRNRKGLRRARALLQEAGWRVDGGVLRNAAGEAFAFELLLRPGAAEEEAIANLYSAALKQLGITMTVSIVDDAQYTARTNDYDFDMTPYRRFLSLSPGNEQMLYWGSKGVTEPGTRNWMGMASPAAEAAIDAILNAPTGDDFVAATRALDRVLTGGRYVIPFWHSPVSRLAHAARLRHPDTLPVYGDWVGFLPDVWWDDEAAR